MCGYVFPIERKDSIITNLGLTSYTLKLSMLSNNDKRADIQSEYQLGFDNSLAFHNSYILYITNDYSKIIYKNITTSTPIVIYDINKCSDTKKIKIKSICKSNNSTINSFIGVDDNNNVYESKVLPSPVNPEPWGTAIFNSTINIKILNTIKVNSITTYYIITTTNNFYIYYCHVITSHLLAYLINHYYNLKTFQLFVKKYHKI